MVCVGDSLEGRFEDSEDCDEDLEDIGEESRGVLIFLRCGAP